MSSETPSSKVIARIALKPFSTRLREFAAGDDVPAGADLSPRTLPSLVAGRFVGDKQDVQ